jgi:sugar phosphate isomerase/epimerase
MLDLSARLLKTPRMKLAVSTYSLHRWRSQKNKSLEQTLDWIAGADVPAVEFAGSIAEEEKDLSRRAGALRRRCEKLGLEVASYCVGAELLVPGAKQKKLIDRLKREVDAAAELGAPTMRHDVTRGFGDYSKGLTGPETFDAALKVVVPAVREVSEYAASQGIRSSLENHGFYMQESKRVEKLIRAVDHPNFGLTIDLGNFLCVNEDPTEATRRLAKYVIMAHAKDFHIKPKKLMPASGWFATPTEICLRGAIAGHGELDLPAALKLLRQAGYDGYLSLEFEGMEDPEQGVRLGLDYLRQLLSGPGVTGVKGRRARTTMRAK